MDDAMKIMRRLGKFDTQLRAIAERRAREEQVLAAAERELAEAEAGSSSRREEIKRLQKEADALNLEVKSSEGVVEKLDGQLRTAKSNKEYAILRRELDAAKGKMSDIETEVLVRLERIDEIHGEEKAAAARIEESAGRLKAVRGAVSAVTGKLDAEAAGLRDEREAVASGLDAEDRRLYEGILNQRGDSAIAFVSDGSCSACARKITPQVENLLSLGKEIVHCMSCRRILFLGEDADKP